MTIKSVTIYGERCSGTNYIENLITENFNEKIEWMHGWKHFFGFDSLENSDETLFICVVRDPYTWVNSLYRTPHHMKLDCKRSIDHFMNSEVISYEKMGTPEERIIEKDKNFLTGKYFANIMEMRDVKTKFLYYHMPKLVKNTIFLRYEDFRKDFVGTMQKLKDKGLTVKKNISFPQNVNKYKKESGKEFHENHENVISHAIIYHHPCFDSNFEFNVLGYNH